MSFNDPFFTDPDYMDKKFRNAKIIFGIITTITLIGYFLWFYILNIAVFEGAKEIEKNGGLGRSIGIFINSIEEEIKK